jgi:uncharacterized small protein (DUF1192 family)
VKAGAISINAAAALATLPEPEQVAAAQGGRDALQQAAKRVRETKKRSQTAAQDTVPEDSVPALKARISVLEAENAQLRAELQALAALA